ncbi:MAG TPA: hypothetical protein VGI81_16320 [Tepidisphaeraceae bacterium]
MGIRVESCESPGNPSFKPSATLETSNGVSAGAVWTWWCNSTFTDWYVNNPTASKPA